MRETIVIFNNNSKKTILDEKEKQQQEMDIKLQRTLLEIKEKYGKNAILKAMNLEEGATAKDRNEQVGGHKG